MTRSATPAAANACATRLVDGELEKLCRSCSTWWPASAEFFGSHAGRQTGLTSRCKACLSDYQALAYRRRLGHRPTASPAMQTLAEVPWLSVTVLPPALLYLFTPRSPT